MSMNFQATLENNTVAMTWAPFNLPAGHSFVYWKVMRSQNTDNPVYKEANSEYIKYDNDIGFTWYKDQSPKKGTTRYRICAITKASDGYHRYCSKEVKKLEYSYQSTTTETYTKPTVTTTSSLTTAQITVLDEIASQFLAKIEAKYSDISKRNEIISNVITQLDILAKRRASMKSMISYLNTKLEAAIDPLKKLKVYWILNS
ncbi:MAG: hypothetical protein PHR61_04310 [Candidatus Absconditabacteria bacterium]|nr:hypothetical protein [Candidatus Absconditabacteria bacterium]